MGGKKSTFSTPWVLQVQKIKINFSSLSPLWQVSPENWRDKNDKSLTSKCGSKWLKIMRRPTAKLSLGTLPKNKRCSLQIGEGWTMSVDKSGWPETWSFIQLDKCVRSQTSVWTVYGPSVTRTRRRRMFIQQREPTELWEDHNETKEAKKRKNSKRPSVEHWL